MARKISTIRKTTDLHFNYPNWETFVDAAINRTNQSNSTASRRKSFSTKWYDTNTFYGTKTFEESVYLAQHGWPEGLVQLEKHQLKLGNLLPTPEVSKLIQYMDYVGPGTVDFDRYIVGHPESLVTYKSEIQESKDFVDILFNGAVSAGISTDQIIQKGALVTSLIDILEKHNIRVRLTLVYAWKQESHYIFINVQLKNYNESLDKEKIVFAIAHPSSCRRLAFSVMVQDQYLHTRYGYPVEYPHTDKEIYVDKSLLGEYTGINFVKQQLVKYSIGVE